MHVRFARQRSGRCPHSNHIVTVAYHWRQTACSSRPAPARVGDSTRRRMLHPCRRATSIAPATLLLWQATRRRCGTTTHPTAERREVSTARCRGVHQNAGMVDRTGSRRLIRGVLWRSHRKRIRRSATAQQVAQHTVTSAARRPLGPVSHNNTDDKNRVYSRCENATVCRTETCRMTTMTLSAARGAGGITRHIVRPNDGGWRTG